MNFKSIILIKISGRFWAITYVYRFILNFPLIYIKLCTFLSFHIDKSICHYRARVMSNHYLIIKYRSWVVTKVEIPWPILSLYSNKKNDLPVKITHLYSNSNFLVQEFFSSVTMQQINIGRELEKWIDLALVWMIPKFHLFRPNSRLTNMYQRLIGALTQLLRTNQFRCSWHCQKANTSAYDESGKRCLRLPFYHTNFTI